MLFSNTADISAHARRRERERERETETETDRQTDRHGQTDRRTQTDRGRCAMLFLTQPALPHEPDVAQMPALSSRSSSAVRQRRLSVQICPASSPRHPRPLGPRQTDLSKKA